MRHVFVWSVLVIGVAGCTETTNVVVLDVPRNLTYELEPSGDPEVPAGLLLRWDGVPIENLSVYRVFSRASGATAFGLRGETTSPTFHDGGKPDLVYVVAAVNLDGVEGPPSDSVIVDERLRLDYPTWIESTSLDGAIHIAWADNAFTAAPDGFKQYRVYSAAYSLDFDLCGEWLLEGTTVAPEFLAGVLVNGQARCFAVSAESIEGWESLFSPIRTDTPRPDARNVVVFADDVDLPRSGFRFFDDLNGDGFVSRSELGIVTSGSGTDIDFLVSRDGSGALVLEPVRAGTSVTIYGSGPVPDLTSIDWAPEAGYSRLEVQALPGWGYVFEMDGGDGFARFGGIRATHVGQDYLIIDWSYQTDPGNPELIPVAQ